MNPLENWFFDYFLLNLGGSVGVYLPALMLQSMPPLELSADYWLHCLLQNKQTNKDYQNDETAMYSLYTLTKKSTPLSQNHRSHDLKNYWTNYENSWHRICDSAASKSANHKVQSHLSHMRLQISTTTLVHHKVNKVSDKTWNISKWVQYNSEQNSSYNNPHVCTTLRLDVGGAWHRSIKSRCLSFLPMITPSPTINVVIM